MAEASDTGELFYSPFRIVTGAAAQLGDDFYFDHVGTPRPSTLPLLTFWPRSSFASHCFTITQLICDSMTL